jgi:hypothetical protein
MKHKVFIGIILLQSLLLLTFYLFSQISIVQRKDELVSKRVLVRELMLTDFAVWTEARYTRHPSQADLFTPFQDFPGSMEHFPAGSIIAPPENIKGLSKIEFSE